MTQYSKYNLVYRLQKWMDSVPGQTFLNYAYSWGASIVILGTLFKLTHLPAANIMLFIGMGTEVFVFFISAFDRPFDKTEVGKDLPTHVYDEDGNEVDVQSLNAPVAGNGQVVSQPIVLGGGTSQPAQQGQVAAVAEEGGVAAVGTGSAIGGSSSAIGGGGTIVIGGGFGGNGKVIETGASPDQSAVSETEGEPNAASTPVSAEQLAAAVNQTAWVQQQQQVSPEMEEATNHYVDELKKLTEMLSKVSEQSERLTRDSEEMENLNRTLTGICKIYEMQLKGASAQVGTIDQINEQSRKMAGQIEQLNKIYARMIEAMTVNMKAAAPTTNLDTNV